MINNGKTKGKEKPPQQQQKKKANIKILSSAGN